MRKKLTIKMWIVVVCLLMLPLGGAFYALGTESEVAWSPYEIAERYCIGEKLTLPAVTADYNGEKQTARGIVYSPDGSVREMTTVVFETAGVYEIEFKATYGTKVFRRRHSVQVGNRIVSTTVPTDTIEYKNESGAVAAGLHVGMEQGSELTVNRPIDLRRLTRDDTILEIYITPSVGGQRDFAGMRITLTDIYDKKNSVVVDYVARNDAKEYGYSTVYAGTAAEQKGIYPADGQAYTVADGRGSIIATSFYGGENVSNSLQLRYDNITNEIFGAKRTDSLSLNGIRLSSRIIDTDSAAYFASPFGGFRTGEVNVSVTPYNYSGKQANFVIAAIAGIDLSAGNFFTDPETPYIAVDYGDYTEDTVPFAIVGKKYTLFTATTDAKSGVETRLYRDYSSSSRVESDIADGTFVPDRAGNYTLVFRATGNYGNTVEKIVSIKAVNENNIVPPYKLTVSLDDDKALTGTEGVAVALPRYSYDGGIGKVATRVAVRYPDGTEVACENDRFIAELAGNYTIVFYAEDYAGQVAAKTVDCRISPNPDPVFTEDVHLLKYFIAGKKYTLPDRAAVRFGAEKKEIAAQIAATGGELHGNVFTPSDSATQAEITYTAVADTGKAQESFVIPVVSVKNGNSLTLGQYFHAPGFDVSAQSNHILYEVSNGANGSADMEFIMPLFAEYFGIDFFVPESSNAMQSVDVVLCDSVNAAEKAFLRITKTESNGAKVAVNGSGAQTPVSVTFAGNAQNHYFSVGYDAATRAFTCDGMYFPVRSTDSGDPFAGFTSGKVYMSLVVNGADGSAAVGVKKVNNQIMTKIVADTIQPELIIDDFFGMYKLGHRLTIPAADVLDVLDPEVTFTFTVLDKDENIVRATDGTLLSEADPRKEYTVSLDSYGTYSFVYYASDSSDNVRRYTVAINVVDDVAPVISVQKGYVPSVKKGTKLTVHAATVTDNLDEEVSYVVMLKDPRGSIEVIDDANVTLSAAGKYVLTYFAMDSSGNIAALQYEITAK